MARPRALGRRRPPRAVPFAVPYAILLPVVLAATAPAGAQSPGAVVIGRPSPELRLDVLAGRATAVHAGAGIAWPIGRHVRLGPVLGVGTAAAGGRTVASGRAELVARFVVEPALGTGWRYHGVAGAGALVTRGAPGVARVHVAVGAEAPPRGGVRPGLELGLGGGVRVGLTLRRP